MENPFSFKGKITRQTLNQFHYFQINYNISCMSHSKKKNLSYFSLLSHTLSLYPTAKEKFHSFSLLSHTPSLCLAAKKKHSNSFFFFGALTHTNYLCRGRQHFALSSLTFVSSSFSFHVALLGCLLKVGNT